MVAIASDASPAWEGRKVTARSNSSFTIRLGVRCRCRVFSITTPAARWRSRGRSNRARSTGRSRYIPSNNTPTCTASTITCRLPPMAMPNFYVILSSSVSIFGMFSKENRSCRIENAWRPTKNVWRGECFAWAAVLQYLHILAIRSLKRQLVFLFENASCSNHT